MSYDGRSPTVSLIRLALLPIGAAVTVLSLLSLAIAALHALSVITIANTSGWMLLLIAGALWVLASIIHWVIEALAPSPEAVRSWQAEVRQVVSQSASSPADVRALRQYRAIWGENGEGAIFLVGPNSEIRWVLTSSTPDHLMSTMFAEAAFNELAEALGIPDRLPQGLPFESRIEWDPPLDSA